MKQGSVVKRYMGTPQCFSTILQREVSFVTSYLLLWMVKPFQEGVCSSKEEFAHKELILPFRSYPRCSKGGKNENGRVLTPESVPIYPILALLYANSGK